MVNEGTIVLRGKPEQVLQDLYRLKENRLVTTRCWPRTWSCLTKRIGFYSAKLAHIVI